MKNREAPLVVIPGEIDGVPVIVEWWDWQYVDENFDIKRVVIPEGISARYCEAAKDMLFFIDATREAYREYADFIPDAHNFYFAGEWEYVDGLPTPIE